VDEVDSPALMQIFSQARFAKRRDELLSHRMQTSVAMRRLAGHWQQAAAHTDGVKIRTRVSDVPTQGPHPLRQDGAGRHFQI
jgi:hypothetical protein